MADKVVPNPKGRTYTDNILETERFSFAIGCALKCRLENYSRDHGLSQSALISAALDLFLRDGGY